MKIFNYIVTTLSVLSAMVLFFLVINGAYQSEKDMDIMRIEHIREVRELQSIEESQSIKIDSLELEVQEQDKKIKALEEALKAKDTELAKKKAIKQTTKKTATKGVLTKRGGVNYFNGRKETWYSQRVLPGGGLKIPGRHVGAGGLIKDKDGYIVVAASDLPKGTITQTSLGAAKVYDSGCAVGTTDIYMDW